MEISPISSADATRSQYAGNKTKTHHDSPPLYHSHYPKYVRENKHSAHYCFYKLINPFFEKTQFISQHSILTDVFH